MDAERTPAEHDPAEHIDSDDPRYDGFRIREYWIATAIAPDNQEAPLWVPPSVALSYHLSEGVAFAADERRLKHLRDYVRMVVKGSDVQVRIRHFVPEGEDEVFG